MTSLFSATVSPAKGSSPSLHCRPSNKPPLRALYDLLIAPMEVVCVHIELDADGCGVNDTSNCSGSSLFAPWFLFPQNACVSLSSGPDAQRRACGPTPTARISAGRRAVPHPVRLAQRQLL